MTNPVSPTLESIARCQDRTLLVVEQLSEKVEARIDHTDEWRSKVDKVLHGDGNGFRGFNVRIDRLEQRASAQNRVIWALSGALGALVLEFLSSLL
ncbi:hypothetical protein LCGC14_2341460 [marine sediment metagenome]|uniref:Uncharacterized protein n=1 Tax=marine sediment metagenome TaxID=412755 RepID=A0A0F9F712_9ZZZZ